MVARESAVPKGVKIARRSGGIGAGDYRTPPRPLEQLEIVVIPHRGRTRRVLLLGVMAWALTCLWRERVALVTTIPWFVPTAAYFLRKRQIIRLEEEELVVHSGRLRVRVVQSFRLQDISRIEAQELWVGAHTLVVVTSAGATELTSEYLDGEQARFIQRELQASLRSGHGHRPLLRSA